MAARVAVVGAGIAGLSAAEAFAASGAARVTLFEAQDRLGGRIATRRQEGLILESGPDGYFAGSPSLEAVIDRLGLRDEIVDVRPGWAGLVREGRVVALPRRMFGGVPVDPREILVLGALSTGARLRLLAEPLVPPRRDRRPAESLDAFLVRRLGRGAARDLVGPLLAGVHAGRAGDLDASVVAPQLVDAEQRWGSILRAARGSGRGGGGVGGGRALRSFETGMGRLVEGFASSLERAGVGVRTGVAVRRLHLADDEWTFEGDEGLLGRFDLVVLAVPPEPLAELLGPLHPEAKAIAASVESVDAVLGHLVAGGLPRDSAFHGAIVPPSESGELSSFSVISAKWPGRAAVGQTLIRVSLRDGSDPEKAAAAIANLIGLARPRVIAVDRSPSAFPIQRLGHGQRVDSLKRAVGALPGLAVIGAAWDGTGLESLVAAASRLPSSIGVRR